MLTYLMSVFHGAHSPERVGPRTSRELQTLAEALDALASGRLPRVGDVLMQRFKALEASVTEGGWSVARRLELLPEAGVGLASLAERQAAAKSERAHCQIEKWRKDAKSGGGADR